MTEKRFEIFPQKVAKDGTLIIIQKGLKLYNISDVVDLLNELHEENKKLKQVNEMLQMDLVITERNLMEENEELKSFKSEVFELIDKKINKLKNTNEVSLIPRESVEILKELKKELEK